MKLYFKPLLGSLVFLLSTVSISAYADVTDTTTQPTVVKHKKHSHKNNPPSPAAKITPATTAPTDKTPATAPLVGDTTSQPRTFTTAYIGNPQSFPIDLGVPGRSFVSTGPYIGVPLVYSGSNLIINSPSVNEDVSLLNMRKAIHARMEALGRPYEDEYAHLLLSGILEGQAWYQDIGGGSNSTHITLSTAELDGYLLGPSQWLSGLFAFAYDGSDGVNEGSLNNNNPNENSRLFLSKAFITVGNFNITPIYGTIGQLYIPYGTFSTNMVSNPLTKTLGRTKARAIVVGFQERGDNAWYSAGYAFNGISHVGATSNVNNGGLNLGYRFNDGKITGDFGGGIIANIADSFGMQDNGNGSPLWGGFGSDGNGNEQINHRVPGLNARGLLSVGNNWNFLAEYIGASKAFSAADMTYNSHGAKPQAVNAEIAYTFSSFFTKPTSLALGYGKSWNALAVELPLQRYVAVINTSWWKDTLESIEFRHDQNYAASSTATGTSTSVTTPINGTGKPNNVVTAQFDIYF